MSASTSTPLRVDLQAIQYTSHEDFLREFHKANFTGLPLPTALTTSSTP
jgi:hypothetical protein